MVDWAMLEGIGGVATTVAILVAVVVGWTQFRQLEAQRRQAATHHYLAAMMQPEVVQAIDAVMQLPDDAPPERIAQDARLRDHVFALDFAVESLGTFVFTGAVGLHDADRICGGFIRRCWRKVRPFMEAERATWQGPNFGEWWQWLVERMEEDPAPGKRAGAHIAFRDWRQKGSPQAKAQPSERP